MPGARGRSTHIMGMITLFSIRGRWVILWSIAACISSGSLPPPTVIPPEMHAAYTLDGRVATASFYVDDSLKGAGTHYSYSASTLEGYLAFYAKKLSEWRLFALEDGLDEDPVAFLETVKDIPKEHLPLVALDHFYGRGGLAGGQRVLIFGTLEPWCEALVLSLGAKNVTTVLPVSGELGVNFF